MTIEEAIEIIKVERKCVETNTQNECDRDCINCDLLRWDEDIFSAYDMAIEALQKNHRCDNCSNGENAGVRIYCLLHTSFHRLDEYCSEWEAE